MGEALVEDEVREDGRTGEKIGRRSPTSIRICLNEGAGVSVGSLLDSLSLVSIFIFLFALFLPPGVP